MTKSMFNWSPWYPLQGSSRNSLIPHLPGLYRIRRCGRRDLDYIGQTGTGTATLRKRLGMLGGVYGEEMPYRAPHTAGPALWALRHRDGVDFEASVMSVEGNVTWRKGLEALAIGLYRQDHGYSPTVNFGRMPVGYLMSSSNDSKLAVAGKRFRGGPTNKLIPQHESGISPTGPLESDPGGNAWCNLRWSDWMEINGAILELYDSSRGLYLIRDWDTREMLYIGQGKLRSRLQVHLNKVQDHSNIQGQIFANARTLNCAFVISTRWADHQRLELENDLIASYMLNTERVPLAQFLG